MSMLLTSSDYGDFNSTNSSTKTAPGTTRHPGVNPTGSRHHRRPRRPRTAPEPRRAHALGIPSGDAARRRRSRGVLGRGVLWGRGPGGHGPGAGELGLPRGGGGWWSGMEVEKSSKHGTFLLGGQRFGGFWEIIGEMGELWDPEIDGLME